MKRYLTATALTAVCCTLMLSRVAESGPAQSLQTPASEGNPSIASEIVAPLIAKPFKLKGKGKNSSNLININFAADPGVGNHGGVIGHPTDHWNFVDYGQQKISKLRSANGKIRDVELSVSQNDGEWGIKGHQDAYHSYIYHNCRCVDLQVELQSLPEGLYEVFVFAHGDAPNQNAAIELQSGNLKLTGKATLNDGSWNFRNEEMQEDNQYVRYVIEVAAGDPLTITSRRDGSEYSMFNAIQIMKIR